MNRNIDKGVFTALTYLGFYLEQKVSKYIYIYIYIYMYVYDFQSLLLFLVRALILLAGQPCELKVH